MYHLAYFFATINPLTAMRQVKSALGQIEDIIKDL